MSVDVHEPLFHRKIEKRLPGAEGEATSVSRRAQELVADVRTSLHPFPASGDLDRALLQAENRLSGLPGELRGLSGAASDRLQKVEYLRGVCDEITNCLHRIQISVGGHRDRIRNLMERAASIGEHLSNEYEQLQTMRGAPDVHRAFSTPRRERAWQEDLRSAQEGIARSEQKHQRAEQQAGEVKALPVEEISLMGENGRTLSDAAEELSALLDTLHPDEAAVEDARVRFADLYAQCIQKPTQQQDEQGAAHALREFRREVLRRCEAPASLEMPHVEAALDECVRYFHQQNPLLSRQEMEAMYYRSLRDRLDSFPLMKEITQLKLDTVVFLAEKDFDAAMNCLDALINEKSSQAEALLKAMKGRTGESLRKSIQQYLFLIRTHKQMESVQTWFRLRRPFRALWRWSRGLWKNGEKQS